ncbi:MAG: hypothetical protein EBZ60_04275 [Betaproteobacteria bacterium]|nr:hypothetical protein [Betaproteobacteria bacterium]
MDDLLLVGGGIGGLSAALALGQLGTPSRLLEQSAEFNQLGAGIGLGPNALHRLHAWGLAPALKQHGFMPAQLQVRDAASGRSLGQLALASSFERRYGAPYMTIHRADLHRVLLDAVQAQGLAQLHLSHEVLRLHPWRSGSPVAPGSRFQRKAEAVPQGPDGPWNESIAIPRGLDRCAVVPTQVYPSAFRPLPERRRFQP